MGLLCGKKIIRIEGLLHYGANRHFVENLVTCLYSRLLVNLQAVEIISYSSRKLEI